MHNFWRFSEVQKVWKTCSERRKWHLRGLSTKIFPGEDAPGPPYGSGFACYFLAPVKQIAGSAPAVLIYSYINTRENWKNSKLCENTPPFGRRVSTQFLVFPISTRVDITVYQHGKCFIFLKYKSPITCI